MAANFHVCILLSGFPLSITVPQANVPRSYAAVHIGDCVWSIRIFSPVSCRCFAHCRQPSCWRCAASTCCDVPHVQGYGYRRNSETPVCLHSGDHRSSHTHAQEGPTNAQTDVVFDSRPGHGSRYGYDHLPAPPLLFCGVNAVLQNSMRSSLQVCAACPPGSDAHRLFVMNGCNSSGHSSYDKDVCSSQFRLLCLC